MGMLKAVTNKQTNINSQDKSNMKQHTCWIHNWNRFPWKE